MSTDADVRRMYGEGLYVQDEGHLGGRYYVDPKHQVTLHTEIGVDRMITLVSYGQGVQLPEKYRTSRASLGKCLSARLTAGEHLQGGIRLGETSTYILQRFGKPKKDVRKEAVRTIHYAAENRPYVVVYEAQYRFRNDRLIGISLYNGE